MTAAAATSATIHRVRLEPMGAALRGGTRLVRPLGDYEARLESAAHASSRPSPMSARSASEGDGHLGPSRRWKRSDPPPDHVGRRGRVDELGGVALVDVA